MNNTHCAKKDKNHCVFCIWSSRFIIIFIFIFMFIFSYLSLVFISRNLRNCNVYFKIHQKFVNKKLLKTYVKSVQTYKKEEEKNMLPCKCISKQCIFWPLFVYQRNVWKILLFKSHSNYYPLFYLRNVFKHIRIDNLYYSELFSLSYKSVVIPHKSYLL